MNMKGNTVYKVNKKKINYILIIGLLVLIIIGGVLIINQVNKNDNDSFDEELYTKDTKSFTISTSYCDLKYPEIWKDEIEIKVAKKDSNEYVQFYASLQDKNSVHLFDIVFGEDGYELGTYETKDGNFVTVNILSYEFEPDESWSEEEKDKIYMMLEDINYILQYLDSLDEYTSMR